MNIRAHWQYYKDCFPFIACLGGVTSLFLGLGMGIAVFCLIAPILGFYCFNALKKEEYLFYFNMGITKKQLYKNSLVINLIVAIPMTLILSLLSFFGSGIRII